MQKMSDNNKQTCSEANVQRFCKKASAVEQGCIFWLSKNRHNRTNTSFFYFARTAARAGTRTLFPREATLPPTAWTRRK